MFNEYFGNYLTRCGLLQPEQLKVLLDKEREQHVKLGMLAIDAGLMTAGQVEEIQNLQRQKDRRFGELAVEQGYLSDEQVQELLRVQRQGHLSLSQAAVDAGYLTLAEIEAALKAYRRETGFNEEQIKALKENDAAVAVEQLVDLGDTELAEDYNHYLVLLVNNIIRFLHERPVVLGRRVQQEITEALYAAQDTDGALTLETGLLFYPGTTVALASEFSGEEIAAEDQELIESSLLEFLNLHNGLFSVNLSNHEREISLAPPQIRTPEAAADACPVFLQLSCGMLGVLMRQRR